MQRTQKASSPPNTWHIVIFPLAAILVVAIDQFTKTWIRSSLDIGQSIPETGFFRLTHIRNSGAAFGLFQGQSELLTIVALAGIAVLLLYAFLAHRRLPFTNSVFIKIALGLILGGTVGNLIDRLRFGYITDFVDVSIWPAFNAADSAIVVGVILFVYSLLTQPQFWRR